MKGLIFTILAFTTTLSYAGKRAVYTCSSDSIKSSRYFGVQLQINEHDSFIANRPVLSAEGTLIERNGQETDFRIPNILGISEFLGVNRHHAYFISFDTFSTIDRFTQLKLVSPFSKLSFFKAFLTLNNSKGIQGLDNQERKVLLKDEFLSCTTTNQNSVYIYR